MLTFFFPMWNEEAMIPHTVGVAGQTGDELIAAGEIADYEILLVDDASNDATGQIADDLVATDPRVRVVHHAVNHGLGGSVRTGLAEARGDLVLYCDADMPFDMHELGKALRLLRAYEADIVSAYRFHRMGEGVRRILYSSIYNALVRTVLRLRIRDVNFAFKLLRREVVEQLELRSEGSFIDAELLAKAQRHGFHIIQFGVDYFPRARGTSTLSSSAVIIQILRELAFLLPSVYRVKPRPGRPRRSA